MSEHHGLRQSEHHGPRRSEHHGHEHHPEPLSYPAARAMALESLLVEKGLIASDVVDALVRTYEQDIGPLNGAKVVARAWVDPAYKRRLLADGTAAIAELGFSGAQGAEMVVLENTPTVHNMVVCTLCSCYPWPVLGLPPTWYKSAAYRSRAVIEPRSVLREFGLDLDESVEIRVWDSTAEVRYLVLPERPTGTDGWSETELATLVTRDAMIGVGLARTPAAMKEAHQ
jgi:nitrile hydratase